MTRAGALNRATHNTSVFPAQPLTLTLLTLIWSETFVWHLSHLSESDIGPWSSHNRGTTTLGGSNLSPEIGIFNIQILALWLIPVLFPVFNTLLVFCRGWWWTTWQSSGSGGDSELSKCFVICLNQENYKFPLRDMFNFKVAQENVLKWPLMSPLGVVVYNSMQSKWHEHGPNSLFRWILKNKSLFWGQQTFQKKVLICNIKENIGFHWTQLSCQYKIILSGG